MSTPVANQVTVVQESAGDPGATANTIKTYSKDVAGVTQLFAEASDGTVSQLTPAAAIAGALTPGSVLFANALGQIAQDNPNFFWDDTNNRLGIGNNAPTTALDVTGVVRAQSLILTAGFMDIADGAAVVAGAAGTARLKYNDTGGVKFLQVSLDGAAYVNVITA